MKSVRLFLPCLFFMFTLSALSQEAADSASVKAEHNRVQAFFETIVDKFVAFFQTKQKLLYKFEYAKSKSGYAAYIIEYTCKEVNYGVTSTNTPEAGYTANVTLTISKRDNRSCGNTASETILGPPAGWDNIEDALGNNKESCFKSYTKAVQSQVRLNFEYKDDHWEFKNVTVENSKEPETALSAALGKVVEPAMEITDLAAVKFNQKWLALVQ